MSRKTQYYIAPRSTHRWSMGRHVAGLGHGTGQLGPVACYTAHCRTDRAAGGRGGPRPATGWIGRTGVDSGLGVGIGSEDGWAGWISGLVTARSCAEAGWQHGGTGDPGQAMGRCHGSVVIDKKTPNMSCCLTRHNLDTSPL